MQYGNSATKSYNKRSRIGYLTILSQRKGRGVRDTWLPPPPSSDVSHPSSRELRRLFVIVIAILKKGTQIRVPQVVKKRGASAGPAACIGWTYTHVRERTGAHACECECVLTCTQVRIEVAQQLTDQIESDPEEILARLCEIAYAFLCLILHRRFNHIEAADVNA